VPRASFRPLVSQSLADQAYAQILGAVRDGSIRPGEKVTERDLAHQLNVSPTPVREALRQLLRDRVIERSGPRSLRVADYDGRTVRELAEVEARLRGMAARLAARKRSPELVAALARHLDEADELCVGIDTLTTEEQGERVARILVALRHFHHRIEQAAENPVFAALLDQARVYSDEERRTRTGERINTRRERFDRRYAEHRQLLDAIARGDEEAAEAIATHHHLTALEDLSS
jgi:DNA-binding GntR family transcriptional regulator